MIVNEKLEITKIASFGILESEHMINLNTFINFLYMLLHFRELIFLGETHTKFSFLSKN